MIDKYGNDWFWPTLIYALGCLINILFSIPKIKSLLHKDEMNDFKYFDPSKYVIICLWLIISSWICVIYTIVEILIEYYKSKKENR